MNIYLPGFEPDFDVRQELRFIGGVLDLRQFDKIFVSVSGGKDSQAMLFLVRNLAEKQGALNKIIAMYADTGMEWHNAESHVRKICTAAGVPLKVVYPNVKLIDLMIDRGIKTNHNGFSPPSSKCRYCTRENKVEPMDVFMRKYFGTLLKVTGERWEESQKRSTYAEFVKLERITTRARKGYGWRPMLQFSTNDVFSMIKNSRVERHVCYDMGCGRLGCAGCIFSPDKQIKIEMRENPHIFEALDKLETDSGYTIAMDGRKLRDRIKD